MKCRICKNKHENQTYMTREMMFGYRDPFEYFQCSKCGCLQIAEYPSNIDKYYGADYYSYQSTGINIFKEYLVEKRDKYEITNKGIIGRLVSRIKPNVSLRTLFLNLLPLLPKNKDIKILDIGCGWGYFLRLLKQVGFVNLTGVDPFIESDIAVNDHFLIFKKNIDELSGKYDLIFLNHSLEHMPNQSGVMNSIYNLLYDNGVCVISIPLSSSYAWKHYGINWVQLDSPRHFYLHSETSLKLLAEMANLTVTAVVYDSSSFQYIISEQYVKDIPKMSVAKGGLHLSSSQIAEYERMATELNITHQGDQAIFFLKHKNPLLQSA